MPLAGQLAYWHVDECDCCLLNASSATDMLPELVVQAVSKAVCSEVLVTTGTAVGQQQ
jgi:hypothetical protein